MATRLANMVRHPLWSHAVYAGEREHIKTVYTSLSEGDVIQTDEIQAPLRVIQQTQPEGWAVSTGELGNSTEYQLRPGDGRKYGLYLHRENSKSGIGEIAVLYRADGSLSTYTEAELGELAEAGPPWTVTFEEVSLTTRGIEQEKQRPHVPGREQAESEYPAAQIALHKVRFEGKDPEDVEGVTQEFEFSERTVSCIQFHPPTARGTPPGTVYLEVEPDDAENFETVVPLDKIQRVN